MPDMVFVFPSSRGNRAVFNSHLGVAYLQAVLRRRGISSVQYLEKKPGTIWQVARRILNLSPRIAGFTVYDSNFGVCVALANCLKTLQPDLRIICGGPTATFSDREILANAPAFDLCIRGEAEFSGFEIIDELLGAPAGQLPDILGRTQGVSFILDDEYFTTGISRDSTGSTYSISCPLDLLPSPYLDGILTDSRAGILTGRGCNQNCVYCQFAALGKKKIRLHSVERVISELELIADHQKNKGNSAIVTIHDDTFSLLPARAGELCQTIADRQLGLRLTCITRADCVDDELLGLMKQAGFTSIAFGLESAVPRVLHMIGKVRRPRKVTPDLRPEEEFIERVRSSVFKAKALGFTTGVSIILGLPGETADEARATVDFVEGLPVDYYMHNILQVFPGTPLWENHRKYSIGVAEGPMGLPLTINYPFNPYKIKPAEKSISNYESGFIRLLTGASAFGCSGALPPHDELDTVIIRSDKISGSMANWLRDNLRIGGLVIQIYTRKVGKESGITQRDRTSLLGAMVPSRFHIQLTPEYKENGSCTWTINSEMAELAGAYSPELTRLHLKHSIDPLLEWINKRKRTCDVCDPGFYDSGRFNDLVSHTGNKALSEILTSWPVPPFLVYPGRFGSGRPPCSNLSRIEIDKKGNLRVCAHGAVMGSINEDFAMVRRRFSRYLEKRKNGHRCPFPGYNIKKDAPGPGVDKCISLIDFSSKTNLLYNDRVEVAQG